jgi:hypothetical protein
LEGAILITITICGVVCGCDDWQEIAAFARAGSNAFSRIPFDSLPSISIYRLSIEVGL